MAAAAATINVARFAWVTRWCAAMLDLIGDYADNEWVGGVWRAYTRVVQRVNDVAADAMVAVAIIRQLQALLAHK